MCEIWIRKEKDLEIERNRMYRQQTEVEQILGRAQEEWKNKEQQTRQLEIVAYPAKKVKVTQKQEQIRAKIGTETNSGKVYLQTLEDSLSNLRKIYQGRKAKRRSGEFTETK